MLSVNVSEDIIALFNRELEYYMLGAFNVLNVASTVRKTTIISIHKRPFYDPNSVRASSNQAVKRVSHSPDVAPRSPDDAKSEKIINASRKVLEHLTGSDTGLKWSSVCLEGREQSANSVYTCEVTLNEHIRFVILSKYC